MGQYCTGVVWKGVDSYVYGRIQGSTLFHGNRSEYGFITNIT